MISHQYQRQRTIKKINFTREIRELEPITDKYDLKMSDLEKDRLSDSVTDMQTYQKTLEEICELNRKINYFDRQRIKLGICLDYVDRQD